MGVMGIEDEVGPPYATKKPAVPCRFIAILAGKGGFAGQPDATKKTVATRANPATRLQF
jgi:hypothetical protein